jgi:hypothetical protein
LKGSIERFLRTDDPGRRTGSRGRSDDLDGGVEGNGIAGIEEIGREDHVGDVSAIDEAAEEAAFSGFDALFREAYSDAR